MGVCLTICFHRSIVCLSQHHDSAMGLVATGTIQATEKAEREKVPFYPATTSDNATNNKSIKKAWVAINNFPKIQKMQAQPRSERTPR